MPLAALAAAAFAQPAPPTAASASAAPGAVRAGSPASAASAASQVAAASSASATSAASPASAASAVGAAASAGIELRRADVLQAPARGDAARQLPIILRAREVHGRPDLDAVAEGDVEFRRGGTVIHADKLTYDQAEDLARATGHVVVTRDGNVFNGPELQLKVERFEGFFRTPTYRFARTGAGGKASLIEFIDDQRAVASDATYSSCTVADGDGDPVWILKAREIRIDNEANEGIARGAVLRFYGVPILASPVLSFPLSEERKSGFLPPSFGIDSRSGFQAAIPYYWNIAPNRDATFTMQESVRRGPSLETEFRYLEPAFFGLVDGKLMPHDSVADRSRYSLRADHQGALPYGAYAQLSVMRVSDDDYWKDFPGEVKSLTPRLLQTDLLVSRPFGDWTTYARALTWQVLQTVDPTTRIDSPYERAPQIGARYAGPWRGGFDTGLEAEFNRFANPSDHFLAADRQTGVRVHALGSITRPFSSPGWSVTPKLSFNAASYSLDLPLADGRRSASRVIPTFSLDSAWTLERETNLFGRAVRQTLEPRLFYVNTPYRRQDDLPNFDSALKDFNFDSLFTENTFSGVDRVSDSNQLTAGVISRVLDPDTGAEALRVGFAQGYRFRDQRITPDNVPLTQHFSDILVFGSTSLVKRWLFDTAVQFNPDSHRIARSLASVRYSPGPFRTVGLTYRLTRGLSEQVELGWQWPVYGPARSGERGERGAGGSAGNGCSGTLYSVGHVNYSTHDSRLTDSLVGLEYDAGCWIGRVVVERLSTGRSEATTRLLLQLELVGLSRLGSNPLKVLKDNVPGYQLLRDERTTTSPFTPYD
ncbi:MAG TPA: LPS-assembly protein LptD [Caldimonas sp.]|jgi:LPS-assembly protein|nr:LPS-assembly protein LptD [Caldimonas sp.]